jgi:uncharacterized protein (TIGR03435 family)
VEDATGLKGAYNFFLDFQADSVLASDGDAAASLFIAVREQLGLRLTAAKVRIETIVVDHVERVPVQNLSYERV